MYTAIELFEDDPAVSVMQWTAAVGTWTESLEPIQIDATSLNEPQQCISVPQSPPTSSGPDIPHQPTEVQLCKNFIEATCGCKKAKGKPCSSLFPLDHYVDLRAQSSFLSHDELDLALLGCIMCTVITDDYVRDGRHKPVKRRRTSISFIHHSHDICKTTFCFLYGVGRRRIMALKESYLANGLETRIHGNKKQLPHNQMTHRAITNVVKFLQNYAEENAILLPGRIPGYRRDDIKLLPSSRSKKVFCVTYTIVCINWSIYLNCRQFGWSIRKHHWWLGYMMWHTQPSAITGEHYCLTL